MPKQQNIFVEDLKELPQGKWMPTDVLCKCEKRHLVRWTLNNKPTDHLYCTNCKKEMTVLQTN